MSAKLTFLGAAGTVTGSRFLLQVNNRHYLVDCGLFQGGRRLKRMNWDPFPLPPEQVDAILLTHAHIDHTGYLPRLVRQGFRGSIYATEATCALAEIMLPDSAYLQEQDAAGHCLPFTGEGIRPALYFGLACGQIVRQVLDGDYNLDDGMAIYREFVARHRWMFRVLRGVQALFTRLSPTVLALPASLLTRPGVLYPIMWAYYRLFHPDVLSDLGASHEAVGERAGRRQDWVPIG